MCSENKGADQLHGYREADLRLCFCICKKSGFLMSRLISYYHVLQYTAILQLLKRQLSDKKNVDILIFALNIVPTKHSTQNLRFRAKIRKCIPHITPVLLYGVRRYLNNMYMLA